MDFWRSSLKVKLSEYIDASRDKIAIYKISDMLQIRGAAYGFFPYKTIREDANGGSYYAKHFSGTEYIGELTVACKLSSLTIAGWADYYTSHKKRVNIGVTLGWFMFNERFIE